MPDRHRGAQTSHLQHLPLIVQGNWNTPQSHRHRQLLNAGGARGLLALEKRNLTPTRLNLERDMQPHLRVLVFCLSSVVATAQAASCRSFDAAQAGSAAGLARDQSAAAAAATVQDSNSDILGKCITGVTSINLVPAFPSLQDIFQAAVDKVCREASDKIAGVASTLPKTIPGTAPMPAVPTPATGAAAPSTDVGTITARAADFWRALWR